MGIPDLSAVGQPQPQQIPKKVELLPAGAGTHIDVMPGPAPGTAALRIFDQPRNEVFLILLSSSYAQELAKELLAPSVAQANGHPPA